MLRHFSLGIMCTASVVLLACSNDPKPAIDIKADEEQQTIDVTTADSASPDCDEVTGCTCSTNQDCGEGFFCDSTGHCVAQQCEGSPGSLACGCREDSPACEPGLRCDPVTSTCVNQCSPPAGEGCSCSDQDDCDEGFFCSESSCTQCEMGNGEGCPCVDDNCEELVCDEGRCRPNKKCSDIVCLPRQLCQYDPDDPLTDATCGDCEPGYQLVSGQCVQTENPADCSLAGVQSILAECLALGRDCLDEDDGGPMPAACSEDCADGFVPRESQCKPKRTCTEIGCPGLSRTCVDNGPNQDFTCGACLPGTVPDASCEGTSCACVPQAGVTCQDIGAQCLQRNERCEEGGPGENARCTICINGFLRDSATNQCRKELTCTGTTTIDCEGRLNRPCIEPGPGADAYCDPNKCLSGFVPVEGVAACVEQVVCASNSCEAGLYCRVENNIIGCYDRPCPDGQALNAMMACETCQLCPVDESSTGNVAPVLFNGNCICETRPGYYIPLEGVPIPQKCDEDGDGWLSQGAYQAVNSLIRVIRDQARCDVRRVSEIIMRPEDGRDVVVRTLDEFGVDQLALVETRRNDSQSEFDQSLETDRPSYAHPPASGGRSMKVEELNSLTKLCVDLKGDFNHDLRPDIAQGDNDEPSSVFPEAAMNAFVARFSYFAELHYSFFEGGRYVIAERPRTTGTTPLPLVPMNLPADEGAYWRTCHRYADVNVERVRNNESKATFDFSRYWDSVSKQGMTHHSQFKCLAVIRDERSELLATTERLHFVARSAVPNLFQFQSCLAEEGGAIPVNGVSARNPVNTKFSCQPIAAGDPRLLQDGFVAWAVVPYTDYGRGSPAVDCRNSLGVDDSSRCPRGISCLNGICQDPRLSQGYRRGCINECAEIAWLSDYHSSYTESVCPQYRETSDPRFACGVLPYEDATSGRVVPDSGRLVCGCAMSYGGESCEIGCGSAGEAGDVFVSEDFNLATRDGVWMCASFNAGDGVPMTDPQQQWQMTLTLPYSTVQRTVVLEGGSGESSYKIY